VLLVSSSRPGFFGLIGHYSVPSGSTEPTIGADGHVLVEGVSYLLGAPHRGDIVTYNTSELLPTEPRKSFWRGLSECPVMFLSSNPIGY
jgi:signal peptidase I